MHATVAEQDAIVEEAAVITKEQAEQAADALLASARAKREKAAERRTRSMVLIFPSLRRIPVLQRAGTLQDARLSADQHWLARALQASLALAFVVFMWSDWAEHVGAARVFGWSAALLFFAWQAQRQIYIRNFLRELPPPEG